MTNAGQLTPDLEPMEREADVLHRVVRHIQERLPRKWSLRLIGLEVELAPGRRADALLEITGPDAATATLAVEIRRVVVTKDLDQIVAQLQSLASVSGLPIAPLVVARYLSPSVRNWLTEREVSFADATGNLRIVTESPSLYLRDTGAERDPWRGPGRPRGTLRGEPAARRR